MHKEIFEDYFEHTNMDYPVGVYYVDMHRMFMESVRTHWHDAMEIDLLRSGSAIFQIGEEDYILDEGSAIWINQGRLHSVKPADDRDCVILSILFHPAYLFEKEDSFLAAKYYTPLTDSAALPCMILRRNDAYGHRALENVDTILEANLNKAYGYELQTKSLLCALWLKLLENAGDQIKDNDHSLTDEQRVKDALEYIHSHFSDALTLDDIANSIHVSRSECCRCFKRSTGGSPFDYLLTHRIFESAKRMQRGDPSADTIQSLAEAVGFNNTSYFNRIFRKYLGITPTRYKDIIKKSHRDALSPYGISLARM